MFPSVTIRNFRCIHDVTMELGPFTVFVGANGAGKTAILDALAPPYKFGDGPGVGDLPSVVFRDHDGRKTKGARVGGPVLQGSATHRYRKLHLNSDSMRNAVQLAPEALLTKDGSNLPNVLGSFGRRKLEMISRAYCKAVPIYQDVDLQAQGNGQHGVVFQDRWRDSRWYQASDVSDGTLVMLALLVACHQDEPADLLAIDEMERGLHPFLLQRVVEMCRELSTGKYGRGVQIVGAMHSPALLDLLQPDEVRFVSRDRKTGHTIVRSAPTDSSGWTAALKTYKNSLGDLWLSGALGGVPGV